MKMLRKYMHNTVFRYELNAMTRRTFGFDFENWMQNGFRAEEYIPYSFEEKGRIVANVSVNWMFFNKNGEEQLCFQLGTVMEDKAYRSRGLIWQLMERILERYDGIETGIYLFGNLGALDFYRKLGFRELMQYEYTLKPGVIKREGRHFRPVKKDALALRERYEHAVRNGAVFSSLEQKNRYGLQMFYTADLETVWYSENLDCFIVLGAEKDTLILAGVAAEQKIPLEMILSRLDIGRRTVRLGFSPLPEDASLFKAAPFDGGEKYRLFYRGEELESIQRERLYFPLLSHA